MYSTRGGGGGGWLLLFRYRLTFTHTLFRVNSPVSNSPWPLSKSNENSFAPYRGSLDLK